jgi:hypothetical protein
MSKVLNGINWTSITEPLLDDHLKASKAWDGESLQTGY